MVNTFAHVLAVNAFIVTCLLKEMVSWFPCVGGGATCHLHEEFLKLCRQKKTNSVENVIIGYLFQLKLMLTKMGAFKDKLPQIFRVDLLMLPHHALYVQYFKCIIRLTLLVYRVWRKHMWKQMTSFLQLELFKASYKLIQKSFLF